MIKNKIKNLNLSATLKINEISKKLEQERKEIIKFGFGESPFPVPDKIVELAVKNIIEGNKIKNIQALANPEILQEYKNIQELKK